MNAAGRIVSSLTPLACILSLVTFIPGCGGGGGGGGGETLTSVSAYNFTEDNTETAAADGMSAVSFFGEFGGIFLQMLRATQQPTAQAPVGIEYTEPLEGVCATGTAYITWNDANNNGLFDQGDSLTLSFTDCDLTGEGTDIVKGSVTAQITEILNPYPYVNMTETVSFNLSTTQTVDASVHTYGLVGNFTLQAVIDPQVGTMTFSNGSITGVEDGLTVIRLGCFTVKLQADSNSILNDLPTGYSLQVEAVLNIRDKIMTITQFNDPLRALDFVYEGYPDGGSVDFLSLGTCASVGAPNGVTDSTGFMIHMTAMPDNADDIRLDLINNNVSPPGTVSTMECT